MHFQTKLFFSGTLTQNISNLDVSNQTNLAKRLLFYVNQLGPNRHTRDDPVHGTSNILDMAFLSPGPSSRDISFSVADDHMGSDRVFPSGGELGGPPMSSMSPLITAVSPHKIQKLSPPPSLLILTKIFLDIFQSLHDKG